MATSWRRTLTIGLAAAVTAGTGALMATPVHAFGGTIIIPGVITDRYAVPVDLPQTWSPSQPSQSCQQPIFGGSTAGFTPTLAITEGTSQTVVCVRLDNSYASNLVVGGAVVINESVPTLPTVLDGNSCRNATNNGVAGPHPLAAPKVLGSEVAYLDVYSGPQSNGATWVCVESGGTAETLLFSGLSGVPTVSFVPDSDSIVP